jgi:hypothetical protein
MPTITLTILLVVLLPNTKAIADTLLEVALIVATVAPHILTIAFRKTINILTSITISI